MAKTEKLASAALGDEAAEKEITGIETVVLFDEGVTPLRYPPNRTDQLHGLSVAEMVRNGQGSVPIDDVNNYDYIDEQGKKFKDDGTLEVHSMSELEWADPAEIYERSQALESQFQKSVITIQHKSEESSDKKSETIQSSSETETNDTK